MTTLWDETLAPWPTRPDGTRYPVPQPRHYASAMLDAADGDVSTRILNTAPEHPPAFRELVLSHVAAMRVTRTLEAMRAANARAEASRRRGFASAPRRGRR